MDESMVEAIFILFHKYKKKTSSDNEGFDINNPTAVRNICKCLAWNNITVKYKTHGKDEAAIKIWKAGSRP